MVIKLMQWKPYPHPQHAFLLPNQTHHHHHSLTLLYLNPHFPNFALIRTSAITATTLSATFCCSCITTKPDALAEEFSSSKPTSSLSSSSYSSSGSGHSMIRSRIVTVDPYVLLFASLFGFVLLFVLRGPNYKDNASVKKKTKKKLLEDQAKSYCDGDFQAGNGSGNEIIVVGAGVAGSALAHTLAKEGRRVHVIERDLTEPDRIVGELLQPGGYLKLIELGLQDCVEKIDAQTIFGYALFKDGKKARVSYPLESFHTDVAGRSFHNGRFVQRMREKAAALPNVKMEQGTVTSLLEEDGTIKGVQYKTKSGQQLKAFAPLTIVCDGCFSNLRRSLCEPKTMVAPQLPSELHDAFVAAIDKGNIRTMPNRSMPANLLPTPRALLMGDAFNMPHPLTGGGMTVALSDIVVLGDLLEPLHDLNDAASLCKYLESFYTLRKPVASTINTLAGALYKVFSASPDEARTEMRQACFDYLSLGGVFSTGPVSLFSGLNPRPLSLVLHFFAVAVYGVGRLLLPFPSPKRLWISARLILNASSIIFSIIKTEGVRHVFSCDHTSNL